MKPIKKYLRWLKNRYVLTLLVAFVWISFFDSFDLRSQYRMHRRIQRLEADKLYYLNQIERLQKEQAMLNNNRNEAEKLARETYLMKRRNEDLYIITND